MYFRFLVEDPSGKIALEEILPKILGKEHRFDILSWHGIGRLPANLLSEPDPHRRTLLDKLPGLLRAAGKEFANFEAAVVVIVDLDGRDRDAFYHDLEGVLMTCAPRPKAVFCLAIEEGEAWLLGDRAAIKAAYPNAKEAVLNSYVQDSICGTWEVLADAVHPGGRASLDKKKVPYSVIGAAKCEWAKKIAPHMDCSRNQSPSFHVFVEEVREILSSAV